MLPIFWLAGLLTGSVVQVSTEELMDRVERVLVLPARAEPFAAYGRNYSLNADGHVIGLLAVPPKPSSRSCFSLMMENGVPGARPCTAAEMDELDRSQAPMRALAGAGQRRWFKTPGSLPTIYDGGCTYIDVDYDPATDHVVRAQCHGA